MLHLGVLPEVAAATCATMILFTAGAPSLLFPISVFSARSLATVWPRVLTATVFEVNLDDLCAGSASVVYLTFGGVKWDYAALMMLTGFFVTGLGQMLTYHVIETMGRRSVIIVAMAVLLSVGAVIIGYESIAAFVRDYPDNLLDHSSICGDDTMSL